MGAAGFVFVDQRMHVRTQEVFRVLIDVLLVHLLAQDGRATSRTTANAAAKQDLDDRDDHQHEAPTADLLAAHPRPKEAGHEAIDECANAADASATFNARETSSAYPTRFFRLRIVPLFMLVFSCASTDTCTTTC